MEESRLTITPHIGDPSLREQIWKIYTQSFAGKEIECVQNQKCYDERTFTAALADPEYTKYYLTIGGRIVAYMLSTNNLQKARVTYMNPERYHALFPGYAPGRIHYCTSLAVLPEYKESKAFYEIMSCFLNHIFNTMDGMLAFDFAHETMMKLPDILQLIWKKNRHSKNLGYVKVGAQEFGALVPVKKPAD